MIEKEIDILPETIKRTFQLRNNHLPGNLKLIIIKDIFGREMTSSTLLIDNRIYFIIIFQKK